MATGESPLDPLFYLHHCNLDRLWAIWQMNNTTVDQYDVQIGHDRDINPNPNVIALEESMRVGTKATPSSMLNHAQLGYQYGPDVPLEQAWFASEGTTLVTAG